MEPVKVQQVDFSPDEWIIRQITDACLISAIGDGFGDVRWTPSEWRDLRSYVLARDEYRCVYCGVEATAVDHVLPKIQGGLTVERNLVAACKPCNSRKGGRL